MKGRRKEEREKEKNIYMMEVGNGKIERARRPKGRVINETERGRGGKHKGRKKEDHNEAKGRDKIAENSALL
jgi:hypothetical protein